MDGGAPRRIPRGASGTILQLQLGAGRSQVGAFLAVGTDQLYLNFLGGGEALEELGEGQQLEQLGLLATELVMGVDIGMTVFVFVFVFVACLLLVRVGRRLVAEQRTPQFLAGHRAAGGDWQGEQLQRFSSCARALVTAALSASVLAACSKPTRFIAGLSSSSSRVLPSSATFNWATPCSCLPRLPWAWSWSWSSWAWAANGSKTRANSSGRMNGTPARKEKSLLRYNEFFRLPSLADLAPTRRRGSMARFACGETRWCGFAEASATGRWT